MLRDSCYCRRAPRIFRHAPCWGFGAGCCQPDVAPLSLRQVYLSLLRMYLSPPSIHCLGPIKLELLEPKANLQAALQVLELHHSKLDTTKVRSCSQGDGGCLQGASSEKRKCRKGLGSKSSMAADISAFSLLFRLTQWLSLFLSLGPQPSASKHSDQ